jgi:hypothetical protein
VLEAAQLSLAERREVLIKEVTLDAFTGPSTAIAV